MTFGRYHGINLILNKNYAYFLLKFRYVNIIIRVIGIVQLVSAQLFERINED